MDMKSPDDFHFELVFPEDFGGPRSFCKLHRTNRYVVFSIATILTSCFLLVSVAALQEAQTGYKRLSTDAM